MAKVKLRRLKAYYGIDNPAEVLSLLTYGVVTAVSCAVLTSTFGSLVKKLAESLPWIPVQIPSFALGFAIAFIALLAFAYWATLLSLLHTSLFLRFRMARKITAKVPDWSKVDAVLDVGCGRGLLLNTVALRLQKEGSGGRAVGVDLWLKGVPSMATTLKAALYEGVGQYVTCKTGDCRDLPFSDAYFDVVVSALFLHNLGQDSGGKSAGASAAALERKRALREMIRVARPGGQIVLWDILHAQEYADFFREHGLEDVELSDSVAAFMLQSHIVSGRKPKSRSTQHDASQ